MNQHKIVTANMNKYRLVTTVFSRKFGSSSQQHASYKFVVVGGGTGGLSIASFLARKFPNQVAVVEPAEVIFFHLFYHQKLHFMYFFFKWGALRDLLPLVQFKKTRPSKLDIHSDIPTMKLRSPSENTSLEFCFML